MFGQEYSKFSVEPRVFDISFNNDMGHAVFINKRTKDWSLPQDISDYCYKHLLKNYIDVEYHRCGAVFFHLKPGLNREWTYYPDRNTVINMEW